MADSHAWAMFQYKGASSHLNPAGQSMMGPENAGRVVTYDIPHSTHEFCETALWAALVSLKP